MIRRLTPDDADAFSALRLLGLELRPDAFATGAAAWRAASPAQRAAAVQPSEDPTDRFVLGAFDGDRLVGQIGFRREGRAAVRHKGSLWGFVVHPEFRRHGLGADLLKAALEAVRACEGLRYLRVVVSVSSEAAMRRFEAQGFVRYGLEAGSLHAGDAFIDQAFLRRDISA